MNRWKWLGVGALGAFGLSVGGWCFATHHYEARVDELRAEIARRGWPTSESDVTGPLELTRDRAPLDGALAQLCEFPDHKGSDLAPVYRDLLRARGAATRNSAAWTKDLDARKQALAAPEFDAFLAALDAVVAANEPCPMQRLEPGLLVCNLRTALLSRALGLVRIHAECALGAGDTATAARDAVRLLGVAQWLGEQSSSLSVMCGKSPRGNGLGVLRDVLDSGAALEPEQRAELQALLERAQPEHEVVRALDAERVLHGDRVWALLRGPDCDRWLDDDTTALNGGALGRPFAARAEAIALSTWLVMREQAERDPFTRPADPDTRGWPEISVRMTAALGSYFGNCVDERRALDLAGLALAGSAPDAADAPRDPVSGAPYATIDADGRRSLRADSQGNPDSRWPLEWPLRG
ncbi:MAG: hypothetical protein EPO68_04895 [Planctomycetota bacterium]|nr:MAG: hypothetical protein EPO68_04895 [Planctomycetota bacterium]